MTTTTIDAALSARNSKKLRRMGCVNAADWFCRRVAGFEPMRLDRYTAQGELFQHVVATDGKIIIDLSPYTDRPRESKC